MGQHLRWSVLERLAHATTVAETPPPAEDAALFDALARLVELLRKAAQRPAPRKPTRPSAGAKRRRLDDKTRRGAIKRLRRTKPAED